LEDELETMLASRHLLKQGYYVPPIVRIGVPKDQPRLRSRGDDSRRVRRVRVRGHRDLRRAGCAAPVVQVNRYSTTSVYDAIEAPPVRVAWFHEPSDELVRLAERTNPICWVMRRAVCRSWST